MYRRFIIAVSGLNADQQSKINDYVKANGGWWHWIDGFWLFRSRDASLSCNSIRDFIGSVKNDCRALVMEIEEDKDWSTFGHPNKQGQTMSAWLMTEWAKPD